MDTTGTQDIDLDSLIEELMRLMNEPPPPPPGKIYEGFAAEYIPPERFDELLAEGWRHFGERFYRYDVGSHGGKFYRVMPLRVRVPDFRPSKSQRRNLRQNADLDVTIRPTVLDAEIHDLFYSHSLRFNIGRPESIYDFLSHKPSTVPVESNIVEVRENGRLVAASFTDLGINSISSIYAIFDPTLAKRGLGTFTMLKELEFAVETGRTYFYPGYAYHEPSFYDYKKRFTAMEKFDWKGNWTPLVQPDQPV